ncbi:MAG: FecR domain-containing protein [Desulfatibacillaceae bacterium]
MKARYIFYVFLVGCLLLSAGSAMAADGARGNAVPSEQLPEALADRAIVDDFVSLPGASVGTVERITGTVVVVHTKTGEAYFAQAGDGIYEQDEIHTLEDTKCRLQLGRGDAVSVAERTRLTIQEYVDDYDGGKKKSLFQVARGKALFMVHRLFGYRDIDSEVHTPTAICGVRGTKFGVEVMPADRETASSGDRYLADASGTDPRYLAQMDVADMLTIIYSFDGTLDVTSTVDWTSYVISTGMFQALTWEGGKPVLPAPPEVLGRFLSDTVIGDGGPLPPTTPMGMWRPLGPDANDVLSRYLLALLRGLNPAVVNALLDGDVNLAHLLAVLSQKYNFVPASYTGPTGYFAGMLTEIYEEDLYNRTYITNGPVALHNTTPPSITGKDIANDPYHMTLVGSPGDGMYLRRVSTDLGDSGDLQTSVPLDTNVLGTSRYMTWGRWQTTAPFTVEGEDFSSSMKVDNSGVFVFGRRDTSTGTEPNLVNGTEDNGLILASPDAYYYGDAFGTVWNAGGGTEISGSFDADVDLVNGSVDNFYMSMSGGQASASIKNAQGQFLTNRDFALNPNTGSWTLNGDTNLTNATATGSVFGPNAEEMGGVVGMDSATGDHMVGAFVGSQSWNE